ncbi:hypothetical protein GXP67_17175 [Rhodocytophaga rosea]|uniref:Uncharacterized protein n=1 Tax=Rhodocytophaga rosea TaxID=2704465 RepID=A0A6C0GJW5_9BACT|nr:hypothetical protein [Rhodocytophaga rosea]QHT68249.1 hypothetical protein GXP67_17175 [Rhodocytophaga rosea]
MKASLYKVLLRTLAISYYQANAGFFFVVIVFAFGLLRPVEHIALITYMLYSPFLLGLLFLVWTLYTLKTVHYIKQAFEQPQHTFLYQFYLFPLPARLWYWLLIQVSLWQPVLLYQAFIIYVGFSTGQITPLYGMALFSIGTLAITVTLYNHWLAKPDPDKHYWAISQFIRNRFTMPYFFFYLGYLTNQHTTLLLLSKAFSCALLVGTVRLYAIEGYDAVILLLGMLFAASGNAIITYRCQEFEQNQLQFIKNMPFPVKKRFLSLMGIYFLLLIPEITICIRYLLFAASPWIILQIILFGLSLLIFYHSYLTKQQLDQETFIRHLFFIGIAVFLLILFRMNGWLFIGVSLSTAYYLYQKHYYSYELITLPEE